LLDRVTRITHNADGSYRQSPTALQVSRFATSAGT
jgi:hypothetical protein